MTKYHARQIAQEPPVPEQQDCNDTRKVHQCKDRVTYRHVCDKEINSFPHCFVS